MNHRLRTTIAWAMLAIGCTSAEERERQDANTALEHVSAEADLEAAAVPLPSVTLAALPARRPRVRVRLTADGVYVDVAPPVIARWRANPRRFFAGAVPGSVSLLVPQPAQRAGVLSRGRISAADMIAAEGGSLVRPLEQQLEALRARDPSVQTQGWALFAGASVPYETIAAIVHTAAHAGLPRFTLAVTANGRAAEIPIGFSTEVDDRDPSQRLGLTLSVQSVGVRVCGSGGCLGPTCDQLAAPSEPITLASGSAGPDWNQVRRCVAKVSHSFPGETEIALRAEPTTPWSAVVAAVAAARGEHGELFANATFGPVVRPAEAQRTDAEPAGNTLLFRPDEGDSVGDAEDFDSQLVVSAIRARLNTIQACYEQRLRTSPTLAGRVKVRFTVEVDGTVSHARAIEDTTGDSSLGACVTTSIAHLRFASGPTGQAVQFEYPFHFAPDETR